MMLIVSLIKSIIILDFLTNHVEIKPFDELAISLVLFNQQNHHFTKIFCLMLIIIYCDIIATFLKLY